MEEGDPGFKIKMKLQKRGIAFRNFGGKEAQIQQKKLLMPNVLTCFLDNPSKKKGNIINISNYLVLYLY